MGNIINLCILAINIIILICMIMLIVKVSVMNKACAKKLDDILNLCGLINQQGSIKNELPKMKEELLSQIKGAVSSAVAEQMKHEIKELQKENESGRQKENQKEIVQHTMEMPKVEAEKIGVILCRNCYKPFSAAESKCPHCNVKRR